MDAILTGCGSAISIAQRVEIPLGPLVTGVISNGGAAIVLVFFGAEVTSHIPAVFFGIFAIVLAQSIHKLEFMLKTINGSMPRGALNNERTMVGP